MLNYHATIHDEDNCETIFEANVVANNDGEARSKVRKYLQNKGDFVLASETIFTMELRFGAKEGIPTID